MNVDQPLKEANEESKEEEKKEEIIIPPPNQTTLQKLTKQMSELYKYNDEASKNIKINNNGSVTFYPTPPQLCQRGKTTFKTTKMTLGAMLFEQECGQPLVYSNPNDDIVQSDVICSFIDAAITAWSQHYPFRFKPQHIWLLILQSVAVHVDQNAEKLRDKYVKHEGKKKLLVEISANPTLQEWANAIDNFAAQIDKNTVEDTCQLFESDFTTSTATDKIATKVTMMDICKNYFDYGCTTDCGFPQITLDGTRSDWVKLKGKVAQLLESKVDVKFGREWRDALLPLLDRFIVAFDGEIDCVFWNSMIKRGAIYGSGAYSWFAGWFNIFFPHIDKRRNRFCEAYSMDKSYVVQGLSNEGNGCENDTDDYPKGLATAPVEWNNNGNIIKLKFIAGFIGYKQDGKSLEITPNVGWCVAQEMNPQELKVKREKEEEDEDW